MNFLPFLFLFPSLKDQPRPHEKIKFAATAKNPKDDCSLPKCCLIMIHKHLQVNPEPAICINWISTKSPPLF